MWVRRGKKDRRRRKRKKEEDKRDARIARGHIEGNGDAKTLLFQINEVENHNVYFFQVTPTLSSSSPQQWLLLLLPHQAWDPYNSR